ncbi:hypothetical protein SAMN04489712_104110 [Thermomonospora echinospora]|uniref:Uncharacterized protein n=1 Tax=Thermomonospora echinospora TaxID=1992 RepID=A0A1H5YR99_9ACTN|nr:hypothetical protein SAMN04489712_104110 [Thermomonospora echinospora]
MQITINAGTRLVVAVGDPVPGNRNNCQAYRDSCIDRALAGRRGIADSIYRDNLGVIVPYRRPRRCPSSRKTSTRRSACARIEQTMTHLKV